MEFSAVVAAIIAVGLFVGLIVAHFMMRSRRRGAAEWLRAMEGAPPRTYGQLATQLWLEALLADKSAPMMFGMAWATRSRPQGPRIVCVNLDLPHVETPGDVFEIVDLSMSRSMGKQERTQRLMQVIGLGAFVAFFMWSYTRHPSSWMPLLMIACYSVIIFGALYRLGIRPVEVGGATAEPGCVRVRRLTQTNTFSREDSALILMTANMETVLALMVRRDGSTWSAKFASGVCDPALQQLIARWSWRDGAAARHVGQSTMENELLP